MDSCANTEALNRYLDEQDREDKAYENLLEALRDVEPDNYTATIAEYGYECVNEADILKDI